MIGLGMGGFSIFKQIKMENPLRLGQVLVNFLCQRVWNCVPQRTCSNGVLWVQVSFCSPNGG